MHRCWRSVLSQSPTGFSKDSPVTQHILNVFSQQVDNGGPVSVPGTGGKIMLLSGQKLSSLLRNLAADGRPGLSSVMSSQLGRLLVPCGSWTRRWGALAQIQQLLKAKTHWEDIVPVSQREGYYKVIENNKFLRHSVTCMNLRNIMPSENSLTQNKCILILYVWRTRQCKT